MKNKWLIGLLTGALAVTMCFGIAACGNNDAEIAKEAIETIKVLYLNEKSETPSDYTVLGQARVDENLYSVEWTATAKTADVTIGDYVTIGKMDESTKLVTIGITRATVDVEYTLKASVTVGSATESVEFDRKIPKKTSDKAITASLDFSSSANRTKLDTDNNEQVWKQNGVTLTNSGNVADYTNPIRLYKNTTVSIEMENARIIHIDFHSAQGYDDSPYPEWLKTSLENSDLPIKGDVTVSDDGLTISVDFETPQEVVTFKTTAGQCRLTSIDVEANERSADEHVHKWTYEHVAGTWTHKATCTAAGCDVKTKTEDCTPKLNVCECGYTYTAKEIVDALFALEKDKSLPGTYTLTGVITKVTEVDTGTYKNCTFEMTVEGQTVTVYRAKGTYYADVKVGGTATVNGELLDYNGTKEFTQGASVVAFTPATDTRTDDQKVKDAKAAFDLTKKTYNETGDFDLPAEYEGTTLTWAVKSGSEYAEIANGKLNVKKLPEADAEVVLTVTIKAGNVSDTKDITVTIKAESETPSPGKGDGTVDHPYSVAEAQAIIAALGSETVYKVNGEIALVYVKGIVTVKGTTDKYGIKNYFMADVAGDTENDICVYSLNWGTVEQGTEIGVGDTIIVTGYLQNFNGTYEVSSYKDSTWHNGTVEAHTPAGGSVEPTPQLPEPVKGTEIDAEGATVFDFSDVAVAEADNYNEIEDDALLAAFDNFEGLTVTKSKIYAGNNTTSGPSDEYKSTGGFLRMGSGKANGTLTLTFTKDVTKIQILCIGWSDSDTIAIDGFNPVTIGKTAKVAYTYTLTEAVKSFTITTGNRALIFKIAVTFADGGETEPQPQPTGKTATYDVSTKSYANGEKVTTVTEGDITFTFSKGSGSSDPAYYNSGAAVRLYPNNTLTISVGEGYYITKISITFASTGDSADNAITVNKGTFTTNTWEGSTQAVVLTAGGTSGHRRIVSVEVEYTATTHVHHYNVAHDADAFTHTFTCDAAGCYDTTYSEACELTENKCDKCNTTYTEDQIKTALFALEAGQSLPGNTYQLTGKVLRINTAYDSKYGNVTFTMKIGENEVEAFRASGEKAETVKPGDTVTVKGGLTNYNGTYQFSAGTILTLTEGELTAEEKVAEVKTWLTLPEAVENVITLPTLPDWAEGVKITWTSATPASVDLSEDGTKLELKPGDADAEVVITASIACEGATAQEKTFTVKVPAKPAEGANSVTYDPATKYADVDSNVDVTTETVENVTITFAANDGTAPKYYKNGTAIRAYAKNTIKISAPGGNVITKITITFGTSDGNNEITADGGTYADGVWTGSAQTVVFTIGGTSGQRRIAKIVVEYAPAPAAADAPAAILPGKKN